MSRLLEGETHERAIDRAVRVAVAADCLGRAGCRCPTAPDGTRICRAAMRAAINTYCAFEEKPGE